jgi:hypothetical protein
MVALLLANGANELKASLSHDEAISATQKALTLADSRVGSLASSKAQVDAALPHNGRTALHEVREISFCCLYKT